MRVLVAGSTGYLGQFLVRNLVELDVDTVALARNPARLAQYQEDIEILAAEVTDPSTLEGCCEAIDVVITSLGITRQQDGLSYMEVDYQANLNLLTEAKRSGVKKFIYVSVLHGEKLKHLQICQAKEKFVEALQESGLNYCVIRPTGFFSDMNEFFNMAQKGKVYLFDKGQYRLNPIHGDDLAKVCIGAIGEDKKQIEVGGPEELTQVDVAEVAFAIVGNPVSITYIPNWLRKVLLALCSLFLSRTKYGPIEFALAVLAMDMIAPKSGVITLSEHFKSLKARLDI